MTSRWLTIALVALGCDEPFSIAPSTTAAPMTVRLSNERAVKDLIDATCARLISCDPPSGAGECAAEMQATTRDYLIGEMCSRGIDASMLASCVVDIESRPCDESRMPIHRLVGCQRAKLCP